MLGVNVNEPMVDDNASLSLDDEVYKADGEINVMEDDDVQDSGYESKELNCNGDEERLRQMRLSALRQVGDSTRQLMDLMVTQAGGHENVGFTKTDLQNALSGFDCREVEVSDFETCLAYFQGKGRVDNGLFVRYSMDERNQLCNLLWADSASRYDYYCFGEVVGFYTVYDRTKYQRPVVMMIGSNSHGRTIVFGVAILFSEMYECYLWLLQGLLDCMNKKEPSTVIIDDNKAMLAAVRDKFPNLYHRICAWHLARNARTYVHNPNFAPLFEGLIFGDMTVSQFESRWRSIVEELQLQNNQWLRDIYEMKQMWATAYIRGTFFGGMEKIQRRESLNGILEEHLKTKLMLYKFVEEMDMVHLRIRNKKLDDNYKSRHTNLVLLSHLKVFEEHAAAVFTRPLFLMVRDEMVDEQDLIVNKVRSRGGIHFYVVCKFLRQDKRWLLCFREFDMFVKCSCKLFESVGIPCCHAFAVLKANHVARIPDSLINHRWTKEAEFAKDFGLFSSLPGNAMVKENVMFGALLGAANRACRIASRDDTLFKYLVKIFHSFCTSSKYSGSNLMKMSECHGVDDADVNADAGSAFLGR